MSVAHEGMEMARAEDFSATLTQEDFAKNLKPPPTSLELRAGRKEPLSLDEAELRQCKLGELCSVAATSRPDICARLARIASKGNSLCGSDVYRINELVRVAEGRQKATVMKYASSSHPWKTPGGGGKAKNNL